MWRLMVPKARHIVALIVFASLLFAVLYFTERHSDSYKAAERFLASDARVASVVGPVTRVEFKFWEGFQAVSSSNGGEAQYTFEVNGSKGSSIIEVHLRSSSGVWRVVTADVRAVDGSTSRIVGMTLVPAAVPLG
ncbi:hypothetical protein [Rubrivivax albus]|uniref:Uncharacterized protein n=1 Tax=Rubrivivax albus TaxID=2499835 RepID=A0A437JKN2_9BURK|nr:hypothetical protein [Rubrivivax albus]RVT47272.1 hypothetical protein ENE75_24245 [Rubrivivax albus]